MRDPTDQERLTRLKANARILWRFAIGLAGGLLFLAVIVGVALLTGHTQWIISYWSILRRVCRANPLLRHRRLACFA